LSRSNFVALQMQGNESIQRGFGDAREWESPEMQQRSEMEDLACFMAGQLLVGEHDDAM